MIDDLGVASAIFPAVAPPCYNHGSFPVLLERASPNGGWACLALGAFPSSKTYAAKPPDSGGGRESWALPHARRRAGCRHTHLTTTVISMAFILLCFTAIHDPRDCFCRWVKHRRIARIGGGAAGKVRNV